MSDTTILQNSTHVIKPKKSVALSGVPAGNTALCTVGKSGNDLHYRGYDILDLAEHCEFEEVAHLLIHGKLPTRDELAAYKTKLKALRGLPANVRTVLEALPAASHPMDVMRTGVSAIGCTLPEKEGHTVSGARDIADKLLASLSSILLYWYHYSHNGERIQPETDDDSIGGHFLQHDGRSHRDVHTTVCYRSRHRLGGAHYRTTSGQQNYPSFRQLCWTGRPPVCRAG